MSRDSSKRIEVGLSARGLISVPRNVYENDFTVIVGDSHDKCSSVFAAFLSHRIGSLQSTDPTIREFNIATKDPHKYFSKIVDLCSGLTISADLDDKDFSRFIGDISGELCNGDLYEQINGSIEGDLTISNVIDRLRFLHGIESDYERELSFISSHFFEIDKSSICSLPFEVFYGIISNSSIQLKDEDSFYEMICDYFDRDSRYFSLFEHVRYEYLSTKSMNSFICLIDESFDFLSFAIWQSLSRRLSLSVSISFPSERFQSHIDSISCPYSTTKSDNLNGFISFLTRKHSCHVLDSNVISITASGVFNARDCPLRHVADFGNRTYFITQSIPNSWICYDFKDMRVSLTHYSVRSRRDADSYHLRSWILEGSIDCESWVDIDHHTNDSSLNGQGAIATFPVSSSSDYQYIRLRQVSMNSNGNHCLVVNAIEFYGTLTILKQ
jgi:hypothetical protein